MLPSCHLSWAVLSEGALRGVQSNMSSAHSSGYNTEDEGTPNKLASSAPAIVEGSLKSSSGGGAGSGDMASKPLPVLAFSGGQACGCNPASRLGMQAFLGSCFFHSACDVMDVGVCVPPPFFWGGEGYIWLVYCFYKLQRPRSFTI
jgi:hypothetical protein